MFRENYTHRIRPRLQHTLRHYLSHTESEQQRIAEDLSADPCVAELKQPTSDQGRERNRSKSHKRSNHSMRP